MFGILRNDLLDDFCSFLFNEEKTQKDYSQDVDDYIYNNPGPELYSFEIWAL